MSTAFLCSSIRGATWQRHLGNSSSTESSRKSKLQRHSPALPLPPTARQVHARARAASAWFPAPTPVVWHPLPMRTTSVYLYPVKYLAMFGVPLCCFIASCLYVCSSLSAVKSWDRLVKAVWQPSINSAENIAYETFLAVFLDI